MEPHGVEDKVQFNENRTKRKHATNSSTGEITQEEGLIREGGCIKRLIIIKVISLMNKYSYLFRDLAGNLIRLDRIGVDWSSKAKVCPRTTQRNRNQKPEGNQSQQGPKRHG